MSDIYILIDRMSSLPYAQLTNLFNPNDFTELDSSLSLATADQRYVRIGSAGYLSSLSTIGNVDAASFSLSGASINLSAISGVTAGTATASKALIVDSSRNIVNINALTATTLNTTSLNVSGNASYTGTNSQISFSGASSLITLSNTTASTSSTTGAIQCAGGAYFGAASIFGGNLDCASLTIGGASINLSAITGVTAGTVTASKALIVDSNKDIAGLGIIRSNGIAITPTNYTLTVPNIPGCLWRTDSTRLCAFREIDTNNWSWGYSGGGVWNDIIVMSNSTYRITINGDLNYTGSLRSSGTVVLDSSRNLTVNDITAADITATNITATTSIASPFANIRDNAQTSGTRIEFLSLGRSSSGSDQGAWAFMNYYQTATQGDSNYFTFGPRLKTGLTTGWGMVMTQNGNVSFQDKNANGGAGGFKIQANIVGTVDIQGGITRTVGAGHGYLQANSGSPAAYNASSVSTRIGLWVENAIWTGDKVYASSDRRLKRDIEPIPLDEAKKLLNVQAVSYRWKKDTEDNMPEIGCIAQELLEAGLAPLVSFCPNNDKENFPEGYQLGLQYSRLPIYMIELIKDLYAQIEELSDGQELLARDQGLLLDAPKELRGIYNPDSSKLKKQPNVRKPLKRPNF